MNEGPEALLSRARAVEALSRLADHLASSGLRGDVYLVGGAAMVLAYDADRLTRDIDAVFAPSAEVRRAAQIVGDDLGLPSGWLNDAAKGFVPGADPAAPQVLDLPGLRVTAASPDHLLGMKLLAARPEQDREDIVHLARMLGLRTSGAVLAVVERLYPPDWLLPRTRFLVEELFPDRPALSSAPRSPPPRRSTTRRRRSRGSGASGRRN